MADILEILTPIISNGETINEAHFETLRTKLNEVIRVVNGGTPTPTEEVIYTKADASLTSSTWVTDETKIVKRYGGDTNSPNYNYDLTSLAPTKTLTRVKAYCGVPDPNRFPTIVSLIFFSRYATTADFDAISAFQIDKSVVNNKGYVEASIPEGTTYIKVINNDLALPEEECVIEIFGRNE